VHSMSFTARPLGAQRRSAVSAVERRLLGTMYDISGLGRRPHARNSQPRSRLAETESVGYN
jgi:hypothetical protein